MHTLYVISVWLHILSAILWIGGMFFLALVVVPWLKGNGRAIAGTFLHETGIRFRTIGWTCFGVLTITGWINLWIRGVRISDLVDAQWLTSPFGKTVATKLALFSVVLIISAIHDFRLGPRAVTVIQNDPTSPAAQKIRRAASQLGRLNALMALIIVALAVMMVRGCPQP